MSKQFVNASGSSGNHEAAILAAMSTAARFNQWMAGRVSPYLGGQVLEVGAGTGNLTELLCRGRQYLAIDINPDYLAELSNRLAREPDLTTAVCDVTNAADFARFKQKMDTVVCLNVLEHIDAEIDALRNIRSALKPGGRAIVLVPQGANVFGTLDQAVNHHRRYARSDLQSKMESAGFRIERILAFNRAAYPGWFLNGRIFRRRYFGRHQLRLFDSLVPLWRLVDGLLPWPPTSLIAIGRRDT